MALTDPVLANNDAVVNAAIEALRINKVLVDEISESLPPSEARWGALQTELRQHKIENAQTRDGAARFGKFFTPDAGRREALNETWPGPPSRRWLEEIAATLKEFSDFDQEMRPMVEHERMREAALEAGIQDFLREHRKHRLVDRRRLVAIVGSHAMIGGYDFKKIIVDENGKLTIKDESSPAGWLIRQFKAAR